MGVGSCDSGRADRDGSAHGDMWILTPAEAGTILQATDSDRLGSARSTVAGQRLNISAMQAESRRYKSCEGGSSQSATNRMASIIQGNSNDCDIAKGHADPTKASSHRKLAMCLHASRS